MKRCAIVVCDDLGSGRMSAIGYIGEWEVTALGFSVAGGSTTGTGGGRRRGHDTDKSPPAGQG